MRWLKSGSFGFAEGSALCVGAKPNVPLVRLAKIVFKNLGQQKNKAEALGCRVGKKSADKFNCCPNVSIVFCHFNSCCVVCYACLYGFQAWQSGRNRKINVWFYTKVQSKN